MIIGVRAWWQLLMRGVVFFTPPSLLILLLLLPITLTLLTILVNSDRPFLDSGVLDLLLLLH